MNKTTLTTSSIWGGRFSDAPHSLMEAINASIDFDYRLYAQDICGSRAHAEMLCAGGIISAEDEARIQQGLTTILEEIRSGTFEFQRALEDIHMNIENRLRDLIGDAAGRLHTARSRNDQVATDLRLWIRDAIDEMDNALATLQDAMITLAEAHTGTIMPGFTHLQSAQPVTFGHHMLAYVEMLGRDRGRFRDARTRMNECPLGAAALAGTSFPIDRHMTARTLGFDAPMNNSLDAVSDRDFVIEYLGAASLCAIHLSRLGEELVIWTSAPFSFVRMADGFSTGSSIMPQKRNPDAAELVRARCGRIIGALNTLLMVMKGLPLAYGKDMQEDKEPVFDASESLLLCIQAMTGMMAGLEVNTSTMHAAAAADFSTATDLADWLVRVLGVPFREAHHITGALVRMAEEQGVSLDALSLADMQRIEPRIHDSIYEVLSVENSVNSRLSFGGTAPKNVAKACAAARTRYVSDT